MALRGRLLAPLAALVALLAGCQPGGLPPGPQPVGGGPVTITWMASPITQDQNDPRQILIDAFERSHPAIAVDLIPGPTSTDVLRDTLRSRIPGGSGQGGPDVYLGDLIWPAAFAQQGLALPLSAHLEPSFWSRFAPGLLDGARYRGALYSAPFFRDEGLLYYRKDLLAQAGLPVPGTWEELAGDAGLLQARGLVRDGFVWTGAPYEGLTCVWTEVAADAGGRLLDPAGARSAVDSPQSLRALRFLRGLVAQGITPPEVTGFTEPQVTAALVSGQAAFARNWNSTYDAVRASPVRDEVGLAPLPAFAGGPRPGASTQGGWDLYVSPSTPHLAAALEFVRWMTDVEAQEIVAREYNDLPTNARVRGEPGLVSGSPVLTALAATTPVPRPAGSPAYPAVSSAVSTNVSQAISGTLAPDAALRAAAQQIDRALARAGSGGR